MHAGHILASTVVADMKRAAGLNEYAGKRPRSKRVDHVARYNGRGKALRPYPPPEVNYSYC